MEEETARPLDLSDLPDAPLESVEIEDGEEVDVDALNDERATKDAEIYTKVSVHERKRKRLILGRFLPERLIECLKI